MSESIAEPLPPSAQIQQVRVAESVADGIRRRILRGEFKSGMLPKQDQLRAEYGISHPSLREALRILETEGLVTVRRGNVGGAVVHRPGEGRFGYAMGLALQSTGAQINELAAALVELEPICARLCAENPDREELIVRPLRELIARTEEDDLNVEEVRFTLDAREFHRTIVDRCGNSAIKLIVGGMVELWSAQEEAWAVAMSSEGDYPGAEARAHVVQVHTQIVDLIAAGKAADVEAYQRRHIRATQELVLSRLDGRLVDGSSAQVRQHLFQI